MTKQVEKKTEKSQSSAKASPQVRFQKTWKRIAVRTPGNRHHAFRLTRAKRPYISQDDMKSGWRLQFESWRFIRQHKRVLLGLGVLYALVAYFLVGGVSQSDFVIFKDATQGVVTADIGSIGTAFSLYGAALTGNLTAAPSSVQQFLSAALIMFFWLAIVWASRMLMADKDIKIRDALYNSGSSVIPTLVVLSVIAVQLLPGAVGIFAYATAVSGGWMLGGVESMLFAAAAILFALLSAYFIVSSLTALIVVTLPGTYPWQALKSARAMVMNRRWGLVFRVLMLAVHVLVVWGLILIPVFLLDGWLRFDWLPLVPIAVQVLIGWTLVYTSVYIYKMYRTLL